MSRLDTKEELQFEFKDSFLAEFFLIQKGQSSVKAFI